MWRSTQIIVLFLLFSFYCCIALSQSKQDTMLANYSTYKRALSFAGLLQTRYTFSMTKNVDVNGKNYPDTVSGVNNSFSLKRVRFQVKAQINDHFDGAILVNFADFSSANVANRVLENAFIRYSLNNHFHIIAGQYRPFFGIEDAIPVDFIKSLDYSNQYTAFGNSGWQSFQIGLCVYGDITGENAKVPLRYYAGVHNGNNRNQPTDNDNNKHTYVRFEVDPAKNVTVGVNGGLGSTQNENGSAWGCDVRSKIPLSQRWTLELTGEYKDGSNFAAFNAFATATKPDIDQFRMRGFYVFPNIRYEYKHPRIRAVEFSTRYEYFDDSYKLNSNPRQTIMPMLAMEFADNYFTCLQIGMYIDMYKNDIPNTTYYSHNAGIVQLQIRF